MSDDGGPGRINAVEAFEMAPSAQHVADRLLPHALVIGTPASVFYVPHDQACISQGFRDGRHEAAIVGLLPESPMQEHDGRRALFVGERTFFLGQMKVCDVVWPVAPTDLLAHEGRCPRRGVNLSLRGRLGVGRVGRAPFLGRSWLR